MKRTNCRWCSTPLTRRQMQLRRQYCSRSCSKQQWHAQHPDRASEIGRRSWRPGGKSRERYIARLRALLAECPSMLEAYRRGYRNGYARGASWRRRMAKARRPAA